MTTEEIQSIKAEIAAAIEGGASLATVVAPQYAPLILLGKSVAKLIGPAFEDIVLLVQKAQPTDADAVALAKEIAGLANPETL